EDISTVEKKLHIEVPAEDVSREYDTFINDIQKKAKIPGFRPGKVPRSIIESRFKKEAAIEVGEQLRHSYYLKAVEEKGIKPLGLPKMDYSEFVTGQAYKYSATIEVKPHFTIQDYTGLDLKKYRYQVTDDKIDKKLLKLQRSHASLKTIDEARSVLNNDVVQIDYEGLHDGKSVLTKTLNAIVELGAGQILKEMEDQIIGMNRGETKTFSAQLPEDYTHKELAGKEVSFQVSLKEIKQIILPEINDDFAKDIGEYQNLEALKADLKQEMGKNFTNFSERELYEQIIDKLIAKAEFEAPKSLVTYAAIKMAEDAERMYASYNISLKDAGHTDESLFSKYLPAAERRVRAELILDNICEQEKFVINDEIVKAGFENISRRISGSIDALKKIYNEDKNKAEDFNAKFLDEHVVQYIIDHSRVEEIDPPEDVKTQI
ncbi:MAG: trigger factor, partial [Pseudomonadota bacterium]